MIHAAIGAVCEQVGDVEAPALGAVAAKLVELLGAHDDRTLYPEKAPAPGEERTVVKGSRVLNGLWWHFLNSEYRKVEDGERLARASLETGGQELAPLTEILNGLRA